MLHVPLGIAAGKAKYIFCFDKNLNQSKHTPNGPLYYPCTEREGKSDLASPNFALSGAQSLQGAFYPGKVLPLSFYKW